MPSPVGHAIAGVAAGWLVAGAGWIAPKFRQGKVPTNFETFGREGVLFGALGALPDIDLLFGAHSGPTHSVGAAIVVGVTAFVIASGLTALSVHDSLPDTTARRALRPGRLALACAAAYASHVLLDWLGTDASPPLGIMALWPFTATYYEADLHVFMAISRRYNQGWTFVVSNVRAVCLELVILVPILAVVTLLRRRRGEWGKA
jgi:hypothetical protein